MELPDLYKHNLTSKEYFEKIVLTFPELESEIMTEDSEDVHYKMECFANYTIKQIIVSDWDELKACFDFQEMHIQSLNPELENAIIVSFCESLLLGEVSNDMNMVMKYMGPLLTKKYKDYEEYYNDLVKKYNSSGNIS